MRKAAITVLSCLGLAACATLASPPPLPTAPEGSSGWLALGETADMGPKITPVSVLEDSRCATGHQCVWAGRVVVLTKISLADGTRESAVSFETGKPVPVADGTVTLVAVIPEKTADATIAPADYRFAYRFDGGY